MIPEEIVEDIRRKADIVQIISSYINVIKKGNSYVAICPFHADSNPSLHISQEKQIYKYNMKFPLTRTIIIFIPNLN